MKTIAAIGLAGLVLTVANVASADDSTQTDGPRVVVSAAVNAGFARPHDAPQSRMKSPGQVVGGFVVTTLGLGLVGGGVGMIGWWVSNGADGVVDQKASADFYSGAIGLIGLGVVATVGGIVLISQGARRVEIHPGLGSLSFTGTF